jgi:hypothetical protein
MSSPMTKIGPRLFFAGRRFEKPGIWCWTGKRNRRVLALPRWLVR